VTIVSKAADGTLAIKVSDPAKVDNIEIIDGEVYIVGKVGLVSIVGSGLTANFSDAEISHVNVIGDEVEAIFNKDCTADFLTITGKNVEIVSDGSISEIDVKGENAVINNKAVSKGTVIKSDNNKQDGQQSSSSGSDPVKYYTYYSISVDAIENGKVIPSKYSAREGETIYVSVVPDEGYQLKPGTLKQNGKVIEGNMFIMNIKDVVITAEFEKIPKPVSLTARVVETDDGSYHLVVICESGNSSIKAGFFEILTPDGRTVLLTSPKVTFNDEKGIYSFMLRQDIPAGAVLRFTVDKDREPAITGKFDEGFDYDNTSINTLSYDLNGGEGIAPASQQLQEGESVTVEGIGAVVPPENKVFLEWNTKKMEAV